MYHELCRKKLKQKNVSQVIKIIFAVVLYISMMSGENVYASEVTGMVQIQNVNSVTGIFDVVISNIGSSDGILGVEIPVWSKKDQSDIVWYSAIKQEDGTYEAHVDVINHDCNFTNYILHVYVRTAEGELKLIGQNIVNLNAPQPEISLEFNSDGTVLKGDAWHVPGTFGRSLEDVFFAVWDEENGQDDLIWYKGNLSGDRYYLSVPLKNHALKGDCIVHVYAEYANGKFEFLGGRAINMPDRTSAKIEITNVNRVSGKCDVVISDVYVISGVQNISVPVWSKSNQSDIVWYDAVKQEDGTYVAHIDVANHGCNFAEYTVHTYVTSKNGNSSRVYAEKVNLCAPDSSLNLESKGDGSSIEIEAWHVPGTLGSSIKEVLFAVWSAENGQDDLRWYTGNINDDKYVTSISMMEHSGNGIYNVHMYVNYINGEQRYVGANTINMQAADGKIKITNVNSVSGVFDVIISDVVARTGVKQIVVPIWSKNNQSDIVWYNPEKQKDGTYRIHVDVANHNCNFAEYKVDVYVLNQINELNKVGGSVVNLNAPSVKVNAVINNNCSEIQIDAWHVPGTFGQSLKGVSYAVWSVDGNQDDIKWYTANLSNDHFVAELDMNHHLDVGSYQVHVYAERVDGKKLITSFVFERPLTKIMGESDVTVAQLVVFYNKNEKYPEFYKNSDAPTIEDFCQIYVEECAVEGVKVEVAFAQAMLETGFMRYKGDVDISQYNFAGIGATGGGVQGNSFSSVREGIRAQVQHLKAYASAEDLNQPCVDPRFAYVTRESAPYLEWLGIQENPYGKGWATGKEYGYKIRDRYVYTIYKM